MREKNKEEKWKERKNERKKMDLKLINYFYILL